MFDLCAAFAGGLNVDSHNCSHVLQPCYVRSDTEHGVKLKHRLGFNAKSILPRILEPRVLVSLILRTQRVATVLNASHHRRHNGPILFQCWPTVCDAGPKLKHNLVNVSCLLAVTEAKDSNFVILKNIAVTAFLICTLLFWSVSKQIRDIHPMLI